MKTPEDLVESIERRANPIFWVAIGVLILILWWLL